MLRATPVSYTHLDVYKRQYQEGTLEAIAYDKNGNKIEKTQGRSVVKTTGKK